MAHAVRLEAVGAPDPLDGTVRAEPRGFRHQGAGPMGCLAGRFAKRQGDDALSRLSPQRLNARGARLVAKQTFERFLHEALLPAPDAGFGFARSPRDLVRANAIGGQKHDLSPPDVLLRRVTVPDEGFEPTNIGGRNGERFSCAHRADSHIPQETGIRAGHKCQVRSTRAFADVGSALRVAMAYETVFDSPHFGHQIWVTGAFAGQRA